MFPFAITDFLVDWEVPVCSDLGCPTPVLKRSKIVMWVIPVWGRVSLLRSFALRFLKTPRSTVSSRAILIPVILEIEPYFKL